MANLVFVLLTLVLLVGFCMLAGYEERRGARVFALLRTRLDRNIERVEFIAAHVNFGAFLLDESRRITALLGHDIAHFSLLVVRSAERLLTRIVRSLRKRRAADTAPLETRGYVKTLSDFKDTLKETHPEVPDIH